MKSSAMRNGPACGHREHVPGCGPCEAGMLRLRHFFAAHGEPVPCPRHSGPACSTCGGIGEVYAIRVRAGECSDGAVCPLRRRGEA